MMYATVADLPDSVRKLLDTATSRRLFWRLVNREVEKGASSALAFSRAWAGLERAGYAEHPDGCWRRCTPAQKAVVAETTRLAKLSKRMVALAARTAEATGARPLYVKRLVLNGDEIVAWAREQGFTSTTPAEELHVTVAFSRQPIPWDRVPLAEDKLTITGGRRMIKPLGDKGAVVLRFEDSRLTARWQAFVDAGASWDHPGYQPHVTITYSFPPDLDPRIIATYAGPIELGPEIAKELDPDWHTRIVEKYNPHQPRDRGGRWTAGAGAGFNAPQLGGKPDPFLVKEPPVATEIDGNANAEDVAVFTSDFEPGAELNGVPFESWQPPTTQAGWAGVDGQKALDEPPMPEITGKRPGSGVIVEEPDGRVWLIEPTNHFGGYEHTFPKGGIEAGLSPQANAIKETWEESGLKVEITGYVGDFERTTSVARYYTARRTGGTPKDHGEESQSVKLVPRGELADFATHNADAPIIATYLGVGKAAINLAQVDARVAKAKGGNWKKQLRAPSGSPIGGQWVAYGAGALGAAVAAMGEPLKLQTLQGANMQHPDIVKGNKLAALYEEKANAGDYQFFKDLEASGAAPKASKGTYSSKTHANYQEAKAYAQAKHRAAMGAAPTAGGSIKPAGKQAGEPEVALSSLNKVGPKPGGTAKGGLYEDADGQKWLVKSYDTADQARQEVLAASLYQAAGASTPEMKLIDTGDTFGPNGVGVMSKWEDGLEFHGPSSSQWANAKLMAQPDFAADAWLANWDVTGLGHDNIAFNTATGKMMRVDPGGSLEYRAMGGKKGTAWNKQASEWDTLRDPKVNTQSAAMFGDMTDAGLKNSAMKVAAVDDATIKAITAKHLPEGQASKMADTLIARRDAIAAKAGIDVDHAKAPGKLDDITLASPAAKAASPAAGGAGAIDAMKPMEAADFPKSTTAGFYANQSAKLVAAAKAGDIETVQKLAAYEPKSIKAQKSTNYQAFKNQADQVLASMETKAAAVPASMGPGAKPASGPQAPAKIGPAPGKLAVNPKNKDAAPIQKKYDQVHALGEAGDVDGLMALIYSTATSGKAMAKKANEWLVHHGYEPKAFAGMNVKADPNKGLHTATVAVAGATPKPAVSQAPKIKAAAAAPKPAFKPDRISEPGMDFVNWNGPGQGLSSVPEVNAANAQAVAAIHATAKGGDLKALDNLTFPELDKATKQPTGKQLSMADHPSQHVKGYLAQVRSEIDYQLHPPKTATITEGGVWDGLKHQVPTYSGKLDDASLAAAGLDKLGKYVVAGEPGVVPKQALADLKPFKAKQTTYAASSKKAYAAMPKSAQKAIVSYTGNGYQNINGGLWEGNPSGAALAAGSAIKTHGVALTPGTMLSRKINLGEADKAKLMKAQGKVLQEPAISSTSITPGTWNGNVQYKMTVGEGVKGLYVGPGTGISQHAGENEVLLPPNTKMLVQKVTPKAKIDADGFGGSTLVEVLILPNA